MKQEYSYKIEQIDAKGATILTEKDRDLVPSYNLGIQSFNPLESRLDVEISDLDGTVLETYTDYQDYTVRGVVQGTTKVNQLDIFPAVFFEGRTFPNDTIIVEYKAFNNVFGKGSDVYIVGISADRTEVRVKSATISPRDLQRYTLQLQSRFNNSSYFSEAFLETSEKKIAIVNALTEVIDSSLVATFKLYEELPESVSLKDLCQVLESLGESSRFKVTRTVTVVEDPLPKLKGPNFAIEVGTNTVATDYSNYLDLLSQKSWESSKGLYTAFKQSSLHTSIDYSDFSSFVHFSSAVERLENVRYKIERILDLQREIQECSEQTQIQKRESEIAGIIENFDHYENFIYFENSPYAWPKKVDPETGLVLRPYVLENDLRIYEKWYDSLYQKAEEYDQNNKDILINTIPVAIREDLDHNEPYLIFIHMIGQHFDDLWIYAKAITDRYKGDNRPDFGISKELVKEAIEHFGLDLYESNQNLNSLFELCQPDGTYDPGLESGSVTDFRRMSPDNYEGQVPLVENYTKEVYKRIYHNIPVLLKTRGTSRGLRVLLNCFGIPSDILKTKVRGGVSVDSRPFFGPEEMVEVSPSFEQVAKSCVTGSIDSVEISGSIDKIRLVERIGVVDFGQVDGTGSFYRQQVVSRYVPVTGSTKSSRMTDDLHKVEVGFDLNEAVNRFFRESLEDFTVDTVLGDPRNNNNQYGDPWKYLRESLLSGLEVDKQFRSPAAIIRFVRYFDTTLFRMLRDFVPARASISHGAIVKDNILHRSRWKGVDVSWTVIIESGSTTGSKVSGSHGGAYKPDYDTGDSKIVSTGGSYVEKYVLSGSREYTGELSGSVLQVSDGELNRKNLDKKAGQPRNRFGFNVWFLDLPDIPLCSSKLNGETVAQRWIVKVGIDSETGDITRIISSSVLGDFQVSNNAAATLFTVPSNSGKLVAPTQWSENGGSGSSTFVGWSWEDGDSLSREIDLVPFEEGKNYILTANYLTGSRQMLWFQAARPASEDSLYYKQDLLITWKNLPAEADPNVAVSSQDRTIWDSPDKIYLTFSKNGVQATFNLPPEEIFGTGEGYFWVGISSASCDHFEGVNRIGEHTRPWHWGLKVVDTQWYENSGEWPTTSWEIVSGSPDPIQNRGNNWKEL